jgi:hypothetical protein
MQPFRTLDPGPTIPTIVRIRALKRNKMMMITKKEKKG